MKPPLREIPAARGSKPTLWPRVIDGFRQRCNYRFPRIGHTAFAAIFHSLPAVIETQLFPGIRATLDLRDETQRTTYWYGTRFEEPTPRILQEWSVGATHFFDIGSNYGFYSFLLLSSAPHLEIYPFEPNPDPFAQLTRICAQNRVARIHPQPYGLSNEEARLQFLQLSDNSGHSSFASADSSQANGAHASLTTCNVLPFDIVIERLSLTIPARPAWLAKIDVEGFELKVLHGMRKSLEKKVFKGICIELLEDNLAEAGASKDAVEKFFEEVGYRRQSITPGPTNKIVLNHNAYFVPKD